MALKPLIYDICCGAGGCTRGYQLAGFRVIGIDYKPFKRYVGDGFILMDAIEFLRRLATREFEWPAAIHASFPCQLFCALKGMPNARKDHVDLITPGRQLLVQTWLPYVIENVPGAPLIPKQTTMLCGTMFGLGTGDAELRRHRLFETNWPLVLPFGMHCKHGRRGARTLCLVGGSGTAEDRTARRNRDLGRRVNDVIGLYGTGGRGRSVAEMEKRRRRTITITGAHGDAGVSIARRKRDGLLYFSTPERNEAMGIDWMKGGELSQSIPPAYCKFVGEKLMEYLASGNGMENFSPHSA